MVRGDPAYSSVGPLRATDNMYFGRYIAVMQQSSQDFKDIYHVHSLAKKDLAAYSALRTQGGSRTVNQGRMVRWYTTVGVHLRTAPLVRRGRGLHRVSQWAFRLRRGVSLRLFR